MSSHRRKEIRDDFVTALTGLAISGTNVFASRVMPMDDDTIPGLTVYTGAEEIDGEGGSRFARVQERALEIHVEAYDKLASGVDDSLDAMIAEVEAAILVVGNIPSASNVDLVSIDEPDIDDGLEKPVGKVKMTFRVQYLTADGDPTTAI
jgi:hypothetical protein